MADIISGRKLEYYATGPDLFLNSSRNGVVTLKSKEFMNQERHQHIIDNERNLSLTSGNDAKLTGRTTSAASWLRSEKEKVCHSIIKCHKSLPLICATIC